MGKLKNENSYEWISGRNKNEKLQTKSNDDAEKIGPKGQAKKLFPMNLLSFALSSYISACSPSSLPAPWLIRTFAASHLLESTAWNPWIKEFQQRNSKKQWITWSENETEKN